METRRKKGKEGRSNGIAVIVIIIGILFCFTLLGAIIGIPIIIWGIHLALQKRGLWICKACGYQIERKIGTWELG